MGLSRWQAIVAVGCLLAGASEAAAQPAPPQVGYVYPAGARQGETAEVTVGGQRLTGVRGAVVSGAGVQVTVVEHVRPITQRELNQLRERLRELQPKRTEADAQKEIADIRTRMAIFFQRMAVPALAETVRLKVTVATDAEPGVRDLRLVTSSGVSNPLVFCVGQLAEFSEKASTDVIDLTVLRNQASLRQQQLAVPSPEMRIDLPAVVNGQVLPGQVDRFRFNAVRGQRIVVAVQARELIPYLADAVPGWFQAAVALYDAKHNEVASADHFQCRPDPAFVCEIPADGEYVLEVRDVIYRGRDDFVYRITVGEVPFVTGIFPLGGRAGTRTTVDLAGWNLPVKQLTFDATTMGPGITSLGVRQGDWVSRRVPFAVDDLPECAETQGNTSPQKAQPVALPIIINGRVEMPGRWDVFRFDGRAGDEVVAEVHARRLGSPLDSVLKLTDERGTVLAGNDDWEDKGSGLNTHHADSYLRVQLPADGPYFVHLGDVQGQAGREYAYRLRISAPRPDFDLRVVPSSVGVRAGWGTPVTVQALRKDGFAGEITLALKDAPPGYTLAGGRIPENQDQVRVTLSKSGDRIGRRVPRPVSSGRADPAVGEDPAGQVRPGYTSGHPIPYPVGLPLGDPGGDGMGEGPPGMRSPDFGLESLVIEGRATIDGREVVRPAVPAEDMMQAFAWRHLVPVQELAVAVLRSAMPRATARILTQGPVRIPAGGTAAVRVGLPLTSPAGTVRFELSDPPEGIVMRSARPVVGGTEIVLASDAEKAKPGLAGNLIFTVYVTPRQPVSRPTTRPAFAPRRVSPGTLPAVPFEVIPAPPGRG